MGRLENKVRLAIRKFGIDADRHSRSYGARRHRIMERVGVTCVIDVGANRGQYAVEVRSEGYKGRILSVEPLASSYELLAARCAHDDLWDSVNTALGREEGECRINVAANLSSSSLLPMNELHLKAEPLSRYQSVQAATMRRLDSVAQTCGLLGERLAIKLDVQGYELEVLAGGEQTIQSTVMVECEVSFAELYAGQPLAGDVLEFMAARGFRAVGVREGFIVSVTDEAMQADILFVRTTDGSY